MYNLYDTIYSLCVEKGITPGKMCTDIGISRGLITDLKKGRKHNANGTTLKKIADYFEVTVDTLLNEPSATPTLKFAQLVKTLNDNPDLQIIVEKLSNTSNLDRKKIINMIDAFEA